MKGAATLHNADMIRLMFAKDERASILSNWGYREIVDKVTSLPSHHCCAADQAHLCLSWMTVGGQE